MQHTPDGGYTYRSDYYSPYIPIPDEGPIAAEIPHLLYLYYHQTRLSTVHPNLVFCRISYGHVCGFDLYIDGRMTHGVRFPEISGDDVYGIETPGGRNKDHDRGLVLTAFAKIREGYCKYMKSMIIKGVKLGVFGEIRFKNLTELRLTGCELTRAEFLTDLNLLKKLYLRHNNQLTELPYDFLDRRIGKLKVLDLVGTSVMCVWGRPSQHPAEWTLASDHKPKDMNALSARVEICRRAGEPAIRAAAAIVLVGKITKKFSRDIARMIAGMIMRTRGRAVWREVLAAEGGK